jgi:hypothetical protein
MRVPLIFQPLARYWRLSDTQARRLWMALSSARYSQPCAWRHHLLLYEATHLGSTDHLIDEVSAPQVVIEVLESLVQEGRLRRAEASEIAECILARVTREQTWEG